MSMEGRLTIDGNDAFALWGVYAVQGGWNELMAFPPLKAVTGNDWQEEDGIEADLSAPRLNTMECTVKFAYCKGADNVADLITLLAKGAYHDFSIKSLGRDCTLRMTQVTAMTADGGASGTVSIKLADDFPLDGAEYDGGRVTFKSKDIKLPCLMRAGSMTEMWRNRDALLYDLVRPGERMLAVDALGQEFPCHYKQCAVSEFFPDGRPWLRFSLTLTLTRNLRINGTAAAASASAVSAQSAQEAEEETTTPDTDTA